jgi:16S rRNA (cytidine1402-2'-O)-methyltransferase
MKGKLFIVSLPIGNIEDITLRAIRTLQEVDEILAEDTREFVKIAKKYNINTKCSSFHNFNEKARHNKVIEELNGGKNFALVSDRGTPICSDPGYNLVKGYKNVTIIPGASVAIAAAALAPINKFIFLGFVENLESLNNYDLPVIFFESPRRIKETLKSLYKQIGNRRFKIFREITKIHEEIIEGQLKDDIDFNNLGEMTIVLYPADTQEDKYHLMAEKIKKYNLPISVSSSILSDLTNLSKNKAYELLLKK